MIYLTIALIVFLFFTGVDYFSDNGIKGWIDGPLINAIMGLLWPLLVIWFLYYLYKK